jgi:hypothetical protein
VRWPFCLASLYSKLLHRASTLSTHESCSSLCVALLHLSARLRTHGCAPGCGPRVRSTPRRRGRVHLSLPPHIFIHGHHCDTMHQIKLPSATTAYHRPSPLFACARTHSLLRAVPQKTGLRAPKREVATRRPSFGRSCGRSGVRADPPRPASTPPAQCSSAGSRAACRSPCWRSGAAAAEPARRYRRARAG